MKDKGLPLRFLGTILKTLEIYKALGPRMVNGVDELRGH
jgi:hypothetical protein